MYFTDLKGSHALCESSAFYMNLIDVVRPNTLSASWSDVQTFPIVKRKQRGRVDILYT